MRIKRSGCLTFHLDGGDVVVHSYASKKIGSCEPAVISLLLGLQDWTSLDSVLERSFLPSREEVIVTLRECLRLGFVILEGSAEAERDEAIASGWLHWQAAATFHFLTKDAAYVRGDASREERLALVSPGPAPDQFKAVAPDLIGWAESNCPKTNSAMSYHCGRRIDASVHRQSRFMRRQRCSSTFGGCRVIFPHQCLANSRAKRARPAGLDTQSRYT